MKKILFALFNCKNTKCVRNVGLQRMRELSVEAANDTYNWQDRQNLQKEVNQLISEINRIADTTQFNNQLLLQGSYSGGKIFHVGANMDQTIIVSITAMRASALGVDTEAAGAEVGLMGSFGLGGSGVDNNNQSAANSAIHLIDNAIDSVTTMRASLGAFQNRFEAVIANLTSISLNTSVARSRILDADIAAETAALTQNNILQQAGTAILAQANQQPSIVLQLLR